VRALLLAGLAGCAHAPATGVQVRGFAGDQICPRASTFTSSVYCVRGLDVRLRDGVEQLLRDHRSTVGVDVNLVSFTADRRGQTLAFELRIGAAKPRRLTYRYSWPYTAGEAANAVLVDVEAALK
jgi:hypothetical protein